MVGGRFWPPLLAFYIGPHRQHYGFADQGDVRKEIMPPAAAGYCRPGRLRRLEESPAKSVPEFRILRFVTYLRYVNVRQAW